MLLLLRKSFFFFTKTCWKTGHLGGAVQQLRPQGTSPPKYFDGPSAPDFTPDTTELPASGRTRMWTRRQRLGIQFPLGEEPRIFGCLPEESSWCI